MMAELKPCPFCGGTKLKVDQKTGGSSRRKDLAFVERILQNGR